MHDPHHAHRAYRQHRQRPSRSGGLLSALFYCGLALVMIVVAVGTFLFVAAPVDIIRDQLAAQVKARTGRDLVIAGRSSLTVYPSLGVSFANITLSAPPAMGGPPTITAESLDVTVSLAPLLSREIEVQRIALRRPVIHLATDAQGRRSWDIGAVELPQRVQLAQATPAQSGRDLPKELQDFVRGSTGGAAGTASVLGRLKAGDLRIEQGTIVISDARTGFSESISALDLRLSYRGLTNPVAFAAQGTLRDEAVDVEGKLASPDRLVESQSSKVDVTLATKTTRARFDGIWSPAQNQAEGALDIDAKSGESLARLLRQPGLAALSAPSKVTALLKLSDGAVNIVNGRLDSGDWNGSGNLTIETAGARPVVRGNVRLSELDVPRLEALAAVAAEASRRRPPAATAPGLAPAAAPKGIGDLIERSLQEPAPAGTKVRGFLKRADWSDAPLDAAALGLLDADLKIAAGRVVFQQAQLGPTQATVGLRSGVLRVTFDDVQLYEGRARGSFTLDSTTRVPAFTLALNADGIAIQPFLRDIADNERISGRGRVVLALAGSGRTERLMMQSLEGKGDILVTNGAVSGLDGMQQIFGILQGKPSGGGGRTEFSELSATAVVTAGVARNSDLKLIGSGIRVGGAGDIDIGQRQIDYLFKPRADAVSVEVPVRARGPWDDVRYNAEMNREKAMEALRELGRQFNGQNVGEIVRGFTQPGENGEPSKAQRLLDRFLKKN